MYMQMIYHVIGIFIGTKFYGNILWPLELSFVIIILMFFINMMR